MTKNDETIPVDEPYIGTFTEERCSVGQLSDNCLYIIAPSEASLTQEALRLQSDSRRWMTPMRYRFYDYTIETTPSIALDSHPLLRRRVELHGDNLILQMHTPASRRKLFLTARVTAENLNKALWLAVQTAEHTARQQTAATLKAFATEEPHEFCRLAVKAASRKRFMSEWLVSVMTGLHGAALGIMPSVSMTSIKERLGVKGCITHADRLKSYSRLLANLKEYRRTHDPKIEAELDLVFNSIDPDTWKRFFLGQSPRIQEKLCDFVNPMRMAEESEITLEVCRMKSIDRNRKNDGYYRLFLRKGQETLMVHFCRKNEFVLYLIYLMDRKRNGDTADTLHPDGYRETFCRLYYMTYGLSGEESFDNMMKNHDSDNEMQQRGLYTVLKSIRTDIGITCERMGEPAEPFVLHITSSHLAILPERIILPQEIMELPDVNTC